MRKSIAITDTALSYLSQNCDNCYIGTVLTEKALDISVEEVLEQIESLNYAKKERRHMVQISLDAWKNLKRIENALIFVKGIYNIPLNDIASAIAIIGSEKEAEV